MNKYTYYQTILIGIIFLQMIPSLLISQKLQCVSPDILYQLPGSNHWERDLQDNLDRMWTSHQEKLHHSQNIPSSRAQLHTVSVVFHIVTGSGPGISDARINNSLNWLNDAFGNRGYYDPTTGADIEVQFCLAKRDERGDPSTGIYRLNSPLADMTMENEDLDLKNLSRQNPRCYVNIWVVDEINSISSGSGVAGYARFPSAHGSGGDGIVVEARFTGVSEAYNSVLVHEMGHYLGLYHTFEGGCMNNDCMVDGDLVCDTPPDQSTGYVSCNGMMNTCNTDTDSGFATDQEDMISNYMDYSQLECYHQFTPLQKERMRFYLEGVRKSLLECKGCNDPCDKNIMAIVTADKYQAIVCDSITISNQSVDADLYEWKLNGQFYSDKKEFKVAFAQPGQYTLIVEARDTDDKCQAYDTLVFQIDCAFSVDLKTKIPVCIDADQPFLIELNNNIGFNTEWYIDNRLESQSPSLNIPYSPGAYRIKVKGDDGKCQDSLSFLLRVGCVEICDNGVDDDGDGLYDCFDPDCCAQCEDFYYDPCLIALADCVEPIPFSIKQKWIAADDNYNPVFSMNCGDMNGDGEVEIVCFDALQGTTFTGPNGNIKYNIPQPNNNRVNWVNPTTIGQVDGDRNGEYYYVNIDNYLNCYRADGSQRFISTQPVENRGGFLQWDPLHLTDLNLDGIPEVVITYNIYNGLTGERYSTWDPSIKQPTVGGHFAIWDMLPDDACPDCEGLEIINGTQIISVSNDLRTLTVVRNYPTTGEGHGCLADWDLDGDLDVVGLIRTGQSGQIIVWDGQTLDRIASQTFMGSSNPHVVANFDADPEPEMAFIDPFSRLLTRFDNDLTTTWTLEIEEPSFISPICFDFHQDGISEIIVRGAQQLRIMNSENGNKIFEFECQSVTNDERPLLADIDGDGHAEIVVSCAGTRGGIRSSLIAFEGDQNEWPKTRPVVHQYGFFNMHINDDLTIPKFAQKHALLHPIQDVNSYMTQIAIPELDTMELALTIDTSWCDGDSLHIIANICTSSDNYPQPLWVSLYNNSPILGGTKRLSSIQVDGSKFLNSSCFLDTLHWMVDADLTNQICAIINDDGSRQLPFDPTDGTGFGGPGECDYINNWDCFELDLPTIQIDPLPDTVICQNIPIDVSVPTGYSNYLWSTNETTEKIRITNPGVYWVKVGDGCSGFASDTFEVKRYQNVPLILPDTIYQCEAGIVVLNIHHSYQFYRWHDASSDSSFTAFGPGKYWVTVKDHCGLIQTDTTYILLKNLPSLDLPDTVRLCPGDTSYIQASNYTNVVWQPNQNITCQECPRPGFFPTQSGWYFAFGVTDEGCVKEDSVFFDINGQVDILDTVAICNGKLAYYRNDSFPAGSHQVMVSNPDDCDTIIQLQVNSTPSDTLFETVPVCFGDSLFYKGMFYQPGSHTVSLESTTECDTTVFLMVDERPEIDATIVTTSSCSQDSSGTATVKPSVSGTRYVLNWSSGREINDSTVVDLPPGNYGVIVIDQLNCSTRFTFTISESSTSQIAFQVKNDSCSDDGIDLMLQKKMTGRLTGNNVDQNGSDFLNLASGLYQLSVFDSNGCFVKDTMLQLNNPATYSFQIQDTIVIDFGQVAMTPILGDTGNISSIQWENNEGIKCLDCPFLNAQPNQTTSYQVTIIDSNGCPHILNVVVIVEGGLDVFVPNIFSPNGDNINDKLGVFSSFDILTISNFQIFSRWGELIYQETDKSLADFQGWDGSFNGELVNPGVFVYRLTYSAVGIKNEMLTGSVTVYR